MSSEAQWNSTNYCKTSISDAPQTLRRKPSMILLRPSFKNTTKIYIKHLQYDRKTPHPNNLLITNIPTASFEFQTTLSTSPKPTKIDPKGPLSKPSTFVPQKTKVLTYFSHSKTLAKLPIIYISSNINSLIEHIMKIPISHLLLLATILSVAHSIYLPLAPKRPRCMMVYTIGDIESVKIFLNLPELPSQGQEENYQFSMRNTETE